MTGKMVQLQFGFINTPYTAQTIMRPMTSAKEESARKRRRHFSKTKTAEVVAEVLEERYHIVDFFYSKYKADMALVLTSAFKDAIGKMVSGEWNPKKQDLTRFMQPGIKAVEKSFRKFLDNKEMDGMVSGVPTAASLAGVRSGRGSKTLQGQVRPSFVDTGIYKASFRLTIGKA